MPKPGGVKTDDQHLENMLRKFDKFTEKMAAAKAEIEAIKADGEITPEEQKRLDQLEPAIESWQRMVENLSAPRPSGLHK